MKHILFAICLLSSAIANAAIIVESSPGVVTAIGDLDIGGTLYNVDFEAVDSAFGTYGGEEFFWTLEPDVRAAVDAINAALNSIIGTIRINNERKHYYLVAGQGRQSIYARKKRPEVRVWESAGRAHIDAYHNCCDTSGTAWSVAAVPLQAVPLPAAGYLLLLALGGLVGIKRFARK